MPTKFEIESSSGFENIAVFPKFNMFRGAERPLRVTRGGRNFESGLIGKPV